MTLDQVMQALKAEGNEGIRKVYADNGVTGPCFGVPASVLNSTASAVGTRSALARELWETGNQDARMLATLVVDPADIDLATATEWATSCDNGVIADALSAAIARSRAARDISDRLRGESSDFAAQVGWNLVTVLARTSPTGNPVEDSWFEPVLEDIEHRLHGCPTRTRHAMNLALCSVGISRTGDLREQALHVAAALGEVKVDHCATPDAVVAIQRATVKEDRERAMKRRLEKRARAMKK